MRERQHPGSGSGEGDNLLPQHSRLMEASAILATVAEARGYRSVHTKAELRRLGFGENQARVPALLIPIWNVRGEIVLYQIRPDEPRIIKGKPIKYETPFGARMVLDVPPPARQWMGDPSHPLFITEGIRKADAAVSKGLACIALLGVWSWRGSNEFGGKAALADWESIALNGRPIYISFDSDISLKPEVRIALLRLKAFLEGRGAEVHVIYLPAGANGCKVGLDDYFAAGHSVDDLLRLSQREIKCEAGDEDTGRGNGQYQVKDGRTCFLRETQEGSLPVPLCNFSARVTEEVVLDDGIETTRAFLIEGTLESGRSLPAVRVPVERFSGMSWVTSSWGLGAVVCAGQAMRDRLREAIQVLSPEVARRQVFAHTGWRCIDGAWRYLTAGGGTAMDGFEVDLGEELSRYSLPSNPAPPAAAMRASLELLEIAPFEITAPLWAGVFRAPLASSYPLDLSLWMDGVTGSLKSTLAALFLSHWGAFDRTNLPGAWSSTANALERRAFILRDAMFVIDDYAPSPLDRRELEIKAARLLRAQGNLAGRGRLKQDLSERPGYHPRGLVVGTGEQLPSGRSIRARTLVIDVERSKVNLGLLTAAQRAADRLPHALAGYVSWLAPQIGTIGENLRSAFASAPARAHEDASHLRLPEALAHLWLGVDCGLTYAEEIGACDSAEAQDLRDRCWEALQQRAHAQCQGLEEEKPTRRYLSILVTLIRQKRVLVLPRMGRKQADRSDPPLVGWYDEEGLFLIPEAAFQVVSRFAAETGEPFAVNQRRLGQDLVGEGIAVPNPGHTTNTVRIGGTSQRVLHLRIKSVEKVIGEDFPFPDSIVTGVTGSTE